MFHIYRFRHYATCNEENKYRRILAAWMPTHFRDTIVTHDVSKQKFLFFESNRNHFSDGAELDMTIRNVLSKIRYDVCKF